MPLSSENGEQKTDEMIHDELHNKRLTLETPNTPNIESNVKLQRFEKTKTIDALNDMHPIFMLITNEPILYTDNPLTKILNERQIF